MDTFTVILKLIGLVILFFVGVVIVVTFGFYFFLFLAFLAAAAAVFCWIIGVPVPVRSAGKKIGYIRWFTFHKLP